MKNVQKKEYVIGIIKSNEHYLILRFKEDYNYCPKDWDFVTDHIDSEEENKDKEGTILRALKKHTNLKGKIKKKFSEYSWLDPEYKILWHYYPFLIETEKQEIDLKNTTKYSEYKWVSENEMLNFDRLGYLKNVISKTLNL